MGREIVKLSPHLDTVNTLHIGKIREEIYRTTNIGHRNARIDVLTPRMLVPTFLKRHVDAAIERWTRWE